MSGIKLEIEQGIIQPGAAPKLHAGCSGVGAVVLEVEDGGKRVRLTLTPQNAKALGVGLIEASAIEGALAEQRKVQAAGAVPNPFAPGRG